MQTSNPNETGHAKNLAHFQSFITYATNLAGAYNPAKGSIKIDALRTLLEAATASLTAVKVAKTAYETATNDREVSFKKLAPTATKALSALAVSDVYDQTVDDARKSYNKIIGRRAGTSTSTKVTTAVATPDAPTEVEEAPKKISVSQLSFDKRVDHFEQLIVTLSSESRYAPNERELSVAYLNELLVELRARNLAVINADAALTSARIARDRIFDSEKSGLVDTAQAVKTYIKSIFGTSSREYQMFSALKFVRRSS